MSNYKKGDVSVDKLAKMSYVYLKDRPLESVIIDTREISAGVFGDFNSEGELVGIEIYGTLELKERS